MADKIYTDMELQEDIILKPVGIIRNDVLKPPLVAGDDGLKLNGTYDSAMKKFNEVPDKISEIIIEESLTDLLYGIEEYSHLIILYWGHEITEDGRSLKKIHPAGLTDYPLKGIFSTCSPARPNPVLMTVVRLQGRENNRLTVSGLDAIDKSPVLDIKPYVPTLFQKGDISIPGWMQKIMTEFQ